MSKNHVCSILKEFSTRIYLFQYFKDLFFKKEIFDYIKKYLIRRIVVCNQHEINCIIANRRIINKNWTGDVRAVVREVEPTIDINNFSINIVDYDVSKMDIMVHPFDIKYEWEVMYSILIDNNCNSLVLKDMAERGIYLGYILNKEIEDKKITIPPLNYTQSRIINNKSNIFIESIVNRFFSYLAYKNIEVDENKLNIMFNDINFGCVKLSNREDFNKWTF